MAPSYSNGNGNGNGEAYYYPSSNIPMSYDYNPRGGEFQSICDDILAGLTSLLQRIWAWCNGPGRHLAWSLAVRGGQQLRRNMTRRRLLNFPHLLVVLWVLVMLWGERWIFASRVRSCDWDRWEDWPAGVTPHRLIFVADPQIIDPHSYPGRPWPLNSLTYLITDNYMRRSYTQLQKVLHPDTVFFLGDLFDGGREWKTDHGPFEDPEWAKDHRPAEEQRHLKQWIKKYGQDFWLKEYTRFGEIFYDNWKLGGVYPGPGQRGRKLISSLPGNHDLGFGAEVKVLARQRFNAYFGETNRVDVIGNHTFVSLDTLSLSASVSSMKGRLDLQPIYHPAEEFLRGVKQTKRRAVQKELRFWRGDVEDLTWEQKVEDIGSADYQNLPTMDLGENAPDFPTILLTHVPLFRNPGTPCGPMREHWPPAKPPKGQATPVIPDHRNAISVSSGYQYQNVLDFDLSINLVKSIGNVIHAFSGDDHDYCEVVHSDKENVREITVKSTNLAMGVPTPGFQMVSLYNPIDEQGNPLPDAPKTTLQTHLCLLPNQLSTYMTYAVLGVGTLLLLIARAFLLPVLNLQPFALDPDPASSAGAAAAVLPIFKAKTEAADAYYHDHDHKTTSSGTSSKFTSSTRAPNVRPRGQSITNGGSGGNSNSNFSPYAPPLPRAGSPLSTIPSSRNGNGKWGWGQSRGSGGPRIEIRRDAYYNAWRPAGSGSHVTLRLVAREIWTSAWRVVWMVGLVFGYFARKG
ncbi:hypothetical protein F5B20DRAFT_556887 [Whalleya microplaca]|nr:hypothetical protein F5B20DRAFT_556887 [Whalleya microplaca]